MPTLNYPASTSLPVGDGMTACGKKPHRSESLAALSFVLTVQSVEERTKKKNPNSTKEAVCNSSWAYPHHPSLQPIVGLQFNWLGTRICLFKTTNLLLQPLQKSETLLRDCWANAARLFQNREELFGKKQASGKAFEKCVKWDRFFIIWSFKMYFIMYFQSAMYCLLTGGFELKYHSSSLNPHVLFLPLRDWRQHDII